MKRYKKLREKQIEYIIKTKEYFDLLQEVVKNIANSVITANNESSIVSIFELELFGFIKEILNLRYYPEKEVMVDTERYISKGRIDSKIGALIIEYKHFSKLKNDSQKKNASDQLIKYLRGLANENTNCNYFLGIVLDGIQCKFITLENDTITEEIFQKIDEFHFDRIIRSIVLLEKVALSPENLVKEFCDTGVPSLSHKITLCLYNILKENATTKTLMLFNEWKELFRLAHDDKSKQKAIEERRASLELVIGEKLKNNNDEYLVLYSLQTTYAIIVKIIAYKVISKIRFDRELIDFNQLSTADYMTLRYQMNSLEEGAIFRILGIGNLLEGDFFSWYSSEHQWTDQIGILIREIFLKLIPYEDKAIFENGENIIDLFKDLFMRIIPDKVRHSLGEYYTPPWLADNLITEALLDIAKKNDWTALDPCAGSGTFLTVLIKKVYEETKSKDKKEILKNILRRVVAIDLNPLAVLTARINYFINISPFISADDIFEIPVYLGDSSYVPSPVKIGDIDCLRYCISTIKGTIDILLPKSAVSDPLIFSQTMTNIEDDIHNYDTKSITKKILKIISDSDKTDEIINNIEMLAEKFVELEKNDWNGIWARIVTNFLTTANLGKFDIIVGNPPWIDWKNLPEGYRERIKHICIDRKLFSGDSITGGINLNICALIANVVAQNWLKSDGILSFLMPQSLIFQQTYEGFRNFILDGNKRLYIRKLFDWTRSGHPFSPVQQKFLTFFFSETITDYKKGISVKYFIKKNRKIDLRKYRNINNFLLLSNDFKEKNVVAGQINKRNTIFTYADTLDDIKKYQKIAGKSEYVGR
jgi:hypothetical protein